MSESRSDQWVSQLRAEALQRFVRPTDTVLEYGIQNELNLACLAAARKIGVSSESKKLSRGIELLPDLSGVSGIDVVLCHRVLEYLPEPAEVLVALTQTLKPGGTLVVVALYDADFKNPRLDRVADHFYSWNVQTLGNLLIDCGYELQSGAVIRHPNEKLAVRWGERGFRFAAALSRLFFPTLEVQVVAKRA